MIRNIHWQLFGLLLVGLLVPLKTQAQVGNYLNLSGPKEDIYEGQEVVVQVYIKAEESTLGTDLVLNYDPDMLGLVEVVPGNVYPENSQIEVEDMIDGEIVFSGAANIGEAVVPEGILCEVRLRALSEGRAKIEIVYESGDTTGTGIVPYEGIEDSLVIVQPDPLWLSVEKTSWMKKIVLWISNILG